MHSVSSRQSSRHHGHKSRPSRRSNEKVAPKNAELEYEDAQAAKEMHLPYYERRAYCSYKQIKVLQPQLDTPIEDYINIKIEE